MWKRLTDAILAAYVAAKPHIMDELPNSQNIRLLVDIKLGDLRELELINEHVKESLGSGVPGDSNG